MTKKPNYTHDAFHMPINGIPAQDTSERAGIAPRKKANKRTFNCEECHAHNCIDCEYACSEKQN
jgi:hypothetical protein